MLNTGTSLIPNTVSRQRAVLFDTLTVAAAGTVAAETDLFGSLRATVGSEKTNMTQAFKLPEPDGFIVSGMRLAAIGCGKSDLELLMKNFTWQVIVGDATPAWDAPMEAWPAGGGIFGATNETSGFTYNNGFPSVDAAFQTTPELPIIINPSDTFRVKMKGTAFTATAAIFVRVYLDGIRTRGIRG